MRTKRKDGEIWIVFDERELGDMIDALREKADADLQRANDCLPANRHLPGRDPVPEGTLRVAKQFETQAARATFLADTLDTIEDRA